MDGTIIQQGQFTSDGTATFIPIRSGVDWMKVYNYTEAGALNNNHGVDYYWQRGMANNDAIINRRNAASTAMQITTALAIPGGPVNGFQLLDTSLQTVGANVAWTAVSGANPPVITTAVTTGLIANQTIVRLYFQTGAGPFAQQLGGIDFTVGVIGGAGFELQNMPAIVASGVVVSNYRIVPFDPIFYPRKRVVSKITQAAQAVVTTTVNHGYQVGQQIRFTNANQVRPGSAAYGMVEINNVTGNIVATTASTFTVDVDTTGFTAFAFPLTANYPFTPLEVVPVGEDTATALAQVPPLDTLNDAVFNTAQIGMLLGAGITSPAGSNNDVVFWVAGKSWNV